MPDLPFNLPFAAFKGRIWLLPGVGKTTVAGLLAQREQHSVHLAIAIAIATRHEENDLAL